MSRKALLALALAILLPLLGYLLLSYYTHRNIHLPRRYFYDSVVVKNDDGKITYDTAWHQVSGVAFTNQLGEKVSLKQLRGKVVVLDFFFTRCPTICPRLTAAMKKLQQSFTPSDTMVHFISISVDPEHDDVEQLRRWADLYHVNPDNWWLLTGNKDSIYQFAFEEMKASVADVNVDTAFIHTENFFLLDKEGVVRGWYNGLDSTEQRKLVHNIPLLMLEKDRDRTFGEFLKELLKKA